MSTEVAWEGLLAGHEPAPPSGARRALDGVWEELLTFSLVLVVLFSVVVSVERANWVVEMPSLGLAALVGLVSGWLLARTRAPAWALHLAGITFGSAIVIGMVMQAMRLADPTTSGIKARWVELWARNGAWLHELRTGGFSTDPLPFVVIVVFAAWFLAYLAAWSIARWRNPWLALAPGALALLTNISYLPGQPAAEFIVFLFGAILLFARIHLLRTMEAWGPGRASAPPTFLSLEVLNLATWVGIGLIGVAWIVPTANHWGPVAAFWERALAPVQERVDRFGRLFVGIDSKTAVGVHRFDAVLPLQGAISLGSNRLMLVEAPAPLYLRGAAYDEYTSSGWRQTATEHPLPDVKIEAASLGTVQGRQQQRAPVVATIHVDSAISRNRLFVFGDPLASSTGAQLLSGGAPEDVMALASRGTIRAGQDYQTVGAVSIATVDRLVTASPDYSQWVRDRYLQLPKDLPLEVSAAARRAVGSERVPYSMAAKVETFLRLNYIYDLSVPAPPPRRDAVAYFLTDARRGYFDYHATAMAVMLRTLGVPARVAVGFALDEGDRDEQTKAFRVSEQQSWAWTEVYFPGYGWVTFNPSPGRAVLLRADEDAPAPTGPDPSSIDLDPQVDDAGAGVDDGAAAAALEAANSGLAQQLTRLSIWLLALSILFVLVTGGVRFSWESTFKRLTPDTRRWAKTQALAALAGLDTRRDQTPLEEARTLSDALWWPPLDLVPVARAYVAVRYGGADRASDPAEAERLDGLYAEARRRLLKRIVRRFIPFAG